MGRDVLSGLWRGVWTSKVLVGGVTFTLVACATGPRNLESPWEVLREARPMPCAPVVPSPDILEIRDVDLRLGTRSAWLLRVSDRTGALAHFHQYLTTDFEPEGVPERLELGAGVDWVTFDAGDLTGQGLIVGREGSVPGGRKGAPDQRPYLIEFRHRSTNVVRSTVAWHRREGETVRVISLARGLWVLSERAGLYELRRTEVSKDGGYRVVPSPVVDFRVEGAGGDLAAGGGAVQVWRNPARTQFLLSWEGQEGRSGKRRYRIEGASQRDSDVIATPARFALELPGQERPESWAGAMDGDDFVVAWVDGDSFVGSAHLNLKRHSSASDVRAATELGADRRVPFMHTHLSQPLLLGEGPSLSAWILKWLDAEGTLSRTRAVELPGEKIEHFGVFPKDSRPISVHTNPDDGRAGMLLRSRRGEGWQYQFCNL